MSGGENKKAANVEAEAEPILSHPDYKFDHKKKRYRHIESGQFASKADVEAAIEASKAAATKVKAEADRMTDPQKIRLPTWNPAKPKLWFIECEKIFKLAKVASTEQETRATLVLW